MADEQHEIPAGEERPPAVPIEEWIIEHPFDSSVYLTRMAAPPAKAEDVPAEK